MSADDPQFNRDVSVYSYPSASRRVLVIECDGEDRVVLDVETALDVATPLLVTAMDVKRGRLDADR